jgi:hypothetical protein
VSIRLKSTRLEAIVVPTKININTVSAGDYCYKVIVGATISTGTWTSAGSTSSVEYNATATDDLTNSGTVVHTGFFSSSMQTRPVIELDGTNFRYQLERNSFTGTAFTFTITIASKDANRSVYGAIDWEEIN